MGKTEQLQNWEKAKKQMNKRKITLGSELAKSFSSAPEHTLCYLSYYKFAARMVGVRKKTLVLDCGEGLGAWLLANECGFACGVDANARAIACANRNWIGDKVEFRRIDSIAEIGNGWDAVVRIAPPAGGGRAFDPTRELEGILSALAPGGVALLGAPVGDYSVSVLVDALESRCAHCFQFSAVDEIIHVGEKRNASFFFAMASKASA